MASGNLSPRQKMINMMYLVLTALLALNVSKEVLDAFEKNDSENLKEELGDLLLQIVLQSKIAEENKLFSFSEVIDNLCEKLIRRHPYVFQEKRPHTIEEQREAYFKIKEFEKSK